MKNLKLSGETLQAMQLVHLTARVRSATLVIVFALLAIWSNPLQYDRANSGRYLLGVLRAADPALFPGDEVVASLGRFQSSFYQVLASGFHMTGAAPESLEPAMHGLYIVSKMLLILVIFALSQSLSRDIWLFVLVGAWALHREGALIGGVALFDPMMTHAEIAILLGMLALTLLFRGRLFWFWVPLCFSIFIHSLVTLHLVAMVVPPLLLLHRERRSLPGFGLFLACTAVYLTFMSPPSLSAAEAQLFLAEKGTINHIAFFNHPGAELLKMLLVLVLVWLSYWHLDKDTPNSRLLACFVGSGTLTALVLSLAATNTEIARLSLFQPVRIMLWVTLCSYLLLAVTTLKALQQRSLAGALLLAVLVLTILDSLWTMAFAALSIGYLLAHSLPFRQRMTDIWKLESLAKVAIGLLVAGMFMGWVLNERLPFESFRNPVPLVAGLFFVALVYKNQFVQSTRWVMIGLMLAYTVMGSSLQEYQSYANRFDPEWYAVQLWSREQTDVNAAFITLTEHGNFRTRSFRTTLSEPMSALAWVDPSLNEANAAAVARVQAGYDGTTWDLDYIFAVADEWGATYVVLDEQYTPQVEPVFEAGPYRIVQISGRE